MGVPATGSASPSGARDSTARQRDDLEPKEAEHGPHRHAREGWRQRQRVCSRPRAFAVIGCTLNQAESSTPSDASQCQSCLRGRCARRHANDDAERGGNRSQTIAGDAEIRCDAGRGSIRDDCGSVAESRRRALAPTQALLHGTRDWRVAGPIDNEDGGHAAESLAGVERLPANYAPRRSFVGVELIRAVRLDYGGVRRERIGRAEEGEEQLNHAD